MEADKFDRTMIALRERVPYQPFTVVLVNGDRHEVDHPKAIVIRDGVAVYVMPGGAPVIFDHEGVRQVIGDLMGQPESPGA